MSIENWRREAGKLGGAAVAAKMTDEQRLARATKASRAASEAREHRERQHDATRAALRELLCWFGPGTAESQGAKCETRTEAIEQARTALGLPPSSDL